MTDLLRIILPAYFILFFAVAIVMKSVIVARRTGKNPFTYSAKDDTAYGLIGFYFKLVMATMFLYIVVYTFFPKWHEHFLPIVQLERPVINYAGLALLFLSLIWIVIAQVHMKNSWRIGIDTGSKTELITGGLFAISRNPIFLGMIITLLGLFLATPNALTGLFLILGYVLIQVQIRLEEEFLAKTHGQEYLNYKQKVRRLI